MSPALCKPIKAAHSVRLSPLLNSCRMLYYAPAFIRRELIHTKTRGQGSSTTSFSSASRSLVDDKTRQLSKSFSSLSTHSARHTHHTGCSPYHEVMSSRDHRHGSFSFYFCSSRHRKTTCPNRFSFSAFSSLSASTVVVDLRSDTVTSPTRPMLECALRAPTGDDVFSEDPTVLALEAYTAELFGKEAALYVPTGTMGNLVAILAHCHGRASEIIIGSGSHVCLYEGGNAANLGGVHTRQIPENEADATLCMNAIRDAYRTDNDDHYAKTTLLCLENTHNLMGGVALSPSYINAMGRLAREELGIRLHIDGARIFNAAIAQNVSVSELCDGADSISVCLSKGLGAPLGSVVVGEKEFIRLAKRARKRCGGGMRQAGVVASMGMYALMHHVERLREDHTRAKRFGEELRQVGFWLPRDGKVDTNIVYFGLPKNSLVTNEELCCRLEEEYGVKVGSGYNRGGKLFRACTHKDVDDEGIDRAIEGIIKICLG